MKWEYKWESYLLGGNEHPESIQPIEFLNRLGQERWEAVSLLPHGEKGDATPEMYTVLLERRKALGSSVM